MSCLKWKIFAPVSITLRGRVKSLPSDNRRDDGAHFWMVSVGVAFACTCETNVSSCVMSEKEGPDQLQCEVCMKAGLSVFGKLQKPFDAATPHLSETCQTKKIVQQAVQMKHTDSFTYTKIIRKQPFLFHHPRAKLCIILVVCFRPHYWWMASCLSIFLPFTSFVHGYEMSIVSHGAASTDFPSRL